VSFYRHPCPSSNCTAHIGFCYIIIRCNRSLPELCPRGFFCPEGTGSDAGILPLPCNNGSNNCHGRGFYKRSSTPTKYSSVCCNEHIDKLALDICVNEDCPKSWCNYGEYLDETTTSCMVSDTAHHS